MTAKKILAIALDSSPPRLIIELAWRLGWTVRVYDFDFMLRSFKWLQKLEADGRVERVLIPPKVDAYSREIACAIATVDAGVGRSVIIVAHRLSTVRDCDKVFYFEGGQKVDEGDFLTLESPCPGFANLAAKGRI